jgi:hypothetical protein
VMNWSAGLLDSLVLATSRSRIKACALRSVSFFCCLPVTSEQTRSPQAMEDEDLNTLLQGTSPFDDGRIQSIPPLPFLLPIILSAFLLFIIIGVQWRIIRVHCQSKTIARFTPTQCRWRMYSRNQTPLISRSRMRH